MIMNLFNLVIPDTTILTPNRRLAATVLNRFNQHQISQQTKSWNSLDILPLTGWLQRSWNELSAKEIIASPLLLTENQKSTLWEMILRKSPESDSLLQMSGTAKLAESAHELLKLWEVNLSDPVLSTTEDSRVFQKWGRQFQKLCKKNNWIGSEDLADILKKNIATGNIVLPRRIILVGFTEISPQHSALLDSFKKSGSEIIHYHANRLAKSIHKVALPDEETEIRTMARWAKAIYEKTSEKKPYLIGCVIPKLETQRESVLRIFSDVFTENNTFTLDHTLLPFNISAGKSLLSFPVIRTAIQLLKMAENNIPLETIISLLRSPFTGDAEKEKLNRSYFENQLKNANVTSISLARLIKSDSSHRFLTKCPAFAKRIRRYLDYFSNCEKILTTAEWAKNFIELLKITGWPGERSLNSEEYQVTQRWLDLLLEYSNLDIVLEPQNFSEAIAWLTKLSVTTVFQAQSPEASIQILGILEAAELPFEHLWVMGMDDTNWPAAPKPNPLIPQRLQKMLNMPHATTERELAWCESLIMQLKQSATNIIFSYPETNGDIHLRPTSLLNSLESVSLTELSLSDYKSPAENIFDMRMIEIFIDETAPPVNENENIRGGTHIFKQQAACPFKSFAEVRLHARSIDTPTTGLRAIDRGNIVHTALELIWKNLKNSRTLIEMPVEELKHIINTCAKKAINKTMESSDNGKRNTRYLELELKRLENILLEWLKLEKLRPEFTVAFQEHEIKATVGNIPITIRMDRIDELADGGQLIIDYKTGKNNEIKKWFGKRPDEPQLPLYCLVGGENISGISFGQLHPDTMSLSGVSKKNIHIKSIKTLPETHHADATLWNQQLHEWKIVLEDLGRNFLQGVAHVDPKDTSQICSHCKLHTFCRIHEK